MDFASASAGFAGARVRARPGSGGNVFLGASISLSNSSSASSWADSFDPTFLRLLWKEHTPALWGICGTSHGLFFRAAIFEELGHSLIVSLSCNDERCLALVVLGVHVSLRIFE